MDQFAVIQRSGFDAARPEHPTIPSEDRDVTKARLFAAMRLVGVAEIVFWFRTLPADSEPGGSVILLACTELSDSADQPAIHFGEIPSAAILLARDLVADCAGGTAAHCNANGTLHFDAKAGTILIDFDEMPDSAAPRSVGA